MSTDKKPCAAKVGPHLCQNPRAEKSLFCARHQSADSRFHLASLTITNERLAYMMQRDGEIQ